MRAKILLFHLVLLACMLQLCDAQNICNTGTEPIYTDQQINVTPGIVYGSAIPAGETTPKNYKYDVYQPPSGNGYGIVLFAGGGFGNVDRTQMKTYCLEFAKRGFVAFTCDYRTGKSNCGTQECECENKLFAIYRALQDSRAAMRHIAHNASAYGIDKDQLLIGGESAGALLAIFITYNNQSEIDNILKGGYDAFGGIDNATNTLTDTFKISGVLNLWGSAYNNKNTLTTIKAGDAPMISFHGEDDATVKYGKSNILYCSSQEKFYGFGSKPLSEKLKELGICYELYSDSNGLHGLSSPLSDFGLGEIPPVPTPEKKVYITERATCFFKSVLCGYCDDINKKKFKDVVNTACSETLSKPENDPASFIAPMILSGGILSLHHFTVEVDEVMVLNLMGELVLKKVVDENVSGIDLSHLPVGIYLVLVVHPQGTVANKILLQ